MGLCFVVFGVVFIVCLLFSLMKEANTLRPNSSVGLRGVYLLDNLESLRVAFVSGNEVSCLIQVIYEAGGGRLLLWDFVGFVGFTAKLIKLDCESSTQEQEK